MWAAPKGTPLLQRGRCPAPYQTGVQALLAEDSGSRHGHRSAPCVPSGKGNSHLYRPAELYKATRSCSAPQGAETELPSALCPDHVWWLIFQHTCRCAQPKGSDPSWLSHAAPLLDLEGALRRTLEGQGLPIRKAGRYRGSGGPGTPPGLKRWEKGVVRREDGCLYLPESEGRARLSRHRVLHCARRGPGLSVSRHVTLCLPLWLTSLSWALLALPSCLGTSRVGIGMLQPPHRPSCPAYQEHTMACSPPP